MIYLLEIVLWAGKEPYKCERVCKERAGCGVVTRNILHSYVTCILVGSFSCGKRGSTRQRKGFPCHMSGSGGLRALMTVVLANLTVLSGHRDRDGFVNFHRVL